MPRALIVTTEATVREAYRQIFSTIGYEVETASGGVDCIEKLRRAPTGILLLDLGIPWGGGDGVLATMRDDCALREVPVFLIPRADYPPAIARLVPLPVPGLMIEALSTQDSGHESPVSSARFGAATRA